MAVSRTAADTRGNAGSQSAAGSLALRLIIVAAFIGLAAWFGILQVRNGAYALVATLAFITLISSIIILRKDTYPLRWMLPGLILMALFSIYPNVYTIYVGFTNYGDGHLLAKPQAIGLIEEKKYLPEGGLAYQWTAFRNEAGEYLLWLIDADGTQFLARQDDAIEAYEPGMAGIGELDSKGIPADIEGYTRLNAILAATDQNLPEIIFGVGEEVVQVRSPSEAATLKDQYVYDVERDIFVDQQSGKEFSPVDGTFVSVDGEELRPGFRANIGLQNFRDFLTSPALRGPLVRIFIWNFIFPAVSVFGTFALGLAIAILFNDPAFKARRIVRTFLLIPYTIPSLITILIWKGMLNPEIGIVNKLLDTAFGISPAWFVDPTLAKIAVVLVNLWLGYPYFMLICSGALQAIPQDIYAAAEVDGANAWQRFTSITLPLLLVSVGPLLIASFVYNFNNFNLIYLFLNGGPPIAGAATRAGHTDILISYVYNLAFAGGRGQNFGLASAVTLIIFILVAGMTLFQFRYTRMWEEVSENV